MRLSTLGAKLQLPQRLRLRCPKCAAHSIVVMFGSGWDVVSGDSLETLSIRPSVWLTSDCQAHFTITDGEVSVVNP